MSFLFSQELTEEGTLRIVSKNSQFLTSVYCAPGTVLSVLHTFILLAPTATTYGRHFYDLHFTHEETEAQSH